MALYLYLRMKGTKCGLLDAETKVRSLRAAKDEVDEMTVKELKARLEEFDENAVVVFPDHEHGDLYVNYAYGGESDY